MNAAEEIADELSAKALVRGRRDPNELRECAANVQSVLLALEHVGESASVVRPSPRRHAPHGRASARPLPSELEPLLAALRQELEQLAPEVRRSIGRTVTFALERYRGGHATLSALVEAIAVARAKVVATRSERT